MLSLRSTDDWEDDFGNLNKLLCWSNIFFLHLNTETNFLGRLLHLKQWCYSFLRCALPLWFDLIPITGNNEDEWPFLWRLHSFVQRFSESPAFSFYQNIHQGVAGYRGPGLHHKMTFITRKQSTTKGIKSLKMTNPATDRDDLLQNLIGNFSPLWPAVLFIHLDYLL